MSKADASPERKTDRERTLCPLVGSHLRRFDDPKLATSAYIRNLSYMETIEACVVGLGLQLICFWEFFSWPFL